MDSGGREGKGYPQVCCDAGHASEAGDMLVSCKCTGHAVNQGGTADKGFIRP